jgi:hypothetical protein
MRSARQRARRMCRRRCRGGRRSSRSSQTTWRLERPYGYKTQTYRCMTSADHPQYRAHITPQPRQYPACRGRHQCWILRRTCPRRPKTTAHTSRIDDHYRQTDRIHPHAHQSTTRDRPLQSIHMSRSTYTAARDRAHLPRDMAVDGQAVRRGHSLLRQHRYSPMAQGPSLATPWAPWT